LTRLGGILSIFVGVGGLLYGILFAYIVAGSPTWVSRTWLVLAMLGGLAVTGVFVALYQQLSPVDHAIALWAALLGVVAGLGQMLNASVGLGYALNPAPEGAYVSEPDPLGILRFGLNGVALLIFAWVMLRSELPKGLTYLAEVGGVLLVVMYLGRLTGIIDPAERITLIPPIVYGLLVHPVLYAWLGRELLRVRRPAAPTS
jgi:hypothetical protein